MQVKLAYKTKEGQDAVLKAYDSYRQEWSRPNQEYEVQTRFGRTFVIECGEKTAPPLILLHGSGMNSLMWMGDAREYGLKYRVYAVDIPGEPGRSDERQLPFQGPDFADWLSDVFLALEIKKAGLIGISLGGWLAIKFAAAYPEKVDKLVLLCPAGVGPQRKAFLFMALFHMISGRNGMKKLMQKVNGNQPIPQDILDYQMLIGKNFNFRRETIPLFTDGELGRLRMPTALFAGEKDILIHSAKTAARLGNLLPHAKIHVLPEAGHTLINLTVTISEFLEQPS